jgi:formylglycine-generating enzyme required for sulfatase activity
MMEKTERGALSRIRVSSILRSEIPEGSFVMGSDPQHKPDSMDREQPPHDLTLPTFSIALFPALMAHFRSFALQEGYNIILRSRINFQTFPRFTSAWMQTHNLQAKYIACKCTLR